MKSANQLYRESGSNKPFKLWLRDEQLKGKLYVHEQSEFLNADGGEESLNIEVVKKKMMIGFVGFVSVGLILYGLYKMRNHMGMGGHVEGGEISVGEI